MPLHQIHKIMIFKKASYDPFKLLFTLFNVIFNESHIEYQFIILCILMFWFLNSPIFYILFHFFSFVIY